MQFATFKSKPKCRIFLRNFSVRRQATFLDLYERQELNIVPLLAVDFSLINLNFDAKQQCTGMLHSLKDNTDYGECLQTLEETFKHWAKFTVPLGFGAKVIPNKEAETCQFFAMNGNVLEPASDNIKACYEGTLKYAQLALPVIF